MCAGIARDKRVWLYAAQHVSKTPCLDHQRPLSAPCPHLLGVIAGVALYVLQPAARL